MHSLLLVVIQGTGFECVNCLFDFVLLFSLCPCPYPPAESVVAVDFVIVFELPCVCRLFVCVCCCCGVPCHSHHLLSSSSDKIRSNNIRWLIINTM